MLAANGPRWFERRRPENSWPSVVVSVAVTAALFVSAFLAMQTVGHWSGRLSEPREPPVVVRLTPAPPPISRPRPTPAPVVPKSPLAPPAAAPTQPIVAPTTTAPVTGVAPTTAVPAAPGARDTAGGAASAAKESPLIPLGPLPLSRSPSDNAVRAPAGAAAREAGVTIGSRVANTEAYRDSMLKAKLHGTPYLAGRYAPTGEMLAALKESQRAARATFRRSTTAGSADVHIPQGEGMNGEGAVGGGSGVQGNGLHVGSGFALPFLSKGPSASQRKKDEIVDAENREVLRLLQDRMLLKRDSSRLDSLRRDSLAKRRP